MKSLKDFVAKKNLSSDTLLKIGLKTRFCSTHAFRRLSYCRKNKRNGKKFRRVFIFVAFLSALSEKESKDFSQKGCVYFRSGSAVNEFIAPIRAV